MSCPQCDYDVVVIGGGIAGIEAAINLGNMGFKVLLVEKSPSLGGKMILLSKVFPTLDCSSCITTPKMYEVLYHPNVDVMTYSEVQYIKKIDEGWFFLRVRRRPRYVNESICTGCQNCEKACPVIVPNEIEGNLIGRKVIHLPFDTASPKVVLVDIDNCIFCGACERACPVGAINFFQEDVYLTVKAGAIIIATGAELFDAKKKPQYGYGRIKNVITAMQMDRLLSPTRPYNSVLRPSDGKVPESIAYILCTGSRDRTIGNPICSQICCMYSIKQSILIQGALPLADVKIFYMDIRAFGKGFEEFYNQAQAMGVMFTKARVAELREDSDGGVIVKYEDIETGQLKEEKFDLVVLAVGLVPNKDLPKLFPLDKLELNDVGYVDVLDPNFAPTETSIRGVFVAGLASGPKDIPDSIMEGAAAAAQAAAYLNSLGIKKVYPKMKVGNND